MNCTFDHLDYTVSLVDSRGGIAGQKEVSSIDSCVDVLCNTTLSSFYSKENEDYRVSIVVSNGIGQSGNITSDSNIGEIYCRLTK